jgi:surface polysaccharide O-acyltransferase-like enzyme
MFIIGLIAFRGSWSLQIPAKTGKLWFRIAAILIVFFPILLIFSSYAGDPSRLAGGFYLQAFAYALWEQILGVAIIISLSVLFREKYNYQGRLLRSMSASAYTVYIIHAPVLVFLAICLRSFALGPLLKFVLIAPLAVSLCFLLSNYIKKLPIARSIL